MISEAQLKTSAIEDCRWRNSGWSTHEATIGMEVWEHDRLNQPDLSKLVVLSRNFHAADISDWDIIMGYDFILSNAIRSVGKSLCHVYLGVLKPGQAPPKPSEVLKTNT